MRSHLSEFVRRRAVLLCLVLLGLGPVSGQDTSLTPQTTAKQISHVTKTLSVPAQNGGVRTLAVSIDNWSISEDATQFDLPPSVSAIMTIVNGRVTVVSAGASKEYATGKFWTAPAGSHLSISIQAPARSAVLRTIIGIPAN